MDTGGKKPEMGYPGPMQGPKSRSFRRRSSVLHFLPPNRVREALCFLAGRPFAAFVFVTISHGWLDGFS